MLDWRTVTRALKRVNYFGEIHLCPWLLSAFDFPIRVAGSGRKVGGGKEGGSVKTARPSLSSFPFDGSSVGVPHRAFIGGSLLYSIHSGR